MEDGDATGVPSTEYITQTYCLGSEPTSKRRSALYSATIAGVLTLFLFPRVGSP